MRKSWTNNDNGTLRLILFAVMILLQIALYVALILLFGKTYPIILLCLLGLSVVLVVYVVSKPEDNPAYKLSWSVAILVLPVFGSLLYLALGRPRLTRRQKKRIRQTADTLCYPAPDDQVQRYLADIDDDTCSIHQYLYNSTRFPAYPNTRTQYLPLGEVMLERMLQELEKAERFIFLEFFIIGEGYMWDTIEEVLTRKAAQGVEIRLLYDDLGSIFVLPRGFVKRLEEKGIQVQAFNSFAPHVSEAFNYRDHRKILVVDNKVAINGGINLADEYINRKVVHGHWKDSALLLEGEAVSSFTAMFLNMWQFTTGTPIDVAPYLKKHSVPSSGLVQPFPDGPTNKLNPAEQAYMQILQRAKKYVFITTPYLIVGQEFLTALKTAALSGVDVLIITPHHADKGFVGITNRAYYGELIQRGVKIYEYEPGFIHAKTFVSDDSVGVVGTINLDFRSFYLHFECGTFFSDTECVAQVRDDFMKTLDRCIPITYEDWRKRSLFQKMAGAMLKFFAPLM